LKSSDIGKTIGYKTDEAPDHINSLIDSGLRKAGMICDVRAEYSVFNDAVFKNEDHSVIISGSCFRVGKIVFSQLKEADSIAVFLCTAGERISTLSKEISKEGDILEGYILDTIGSEVVEAAADIMQDRLKEEMTGTGKNSTNRFSPGYCGWNLSEQPAIFQIMPDNFCHIKLTESSLMMPIKSISGFIGIGKNARFAPYKCKICNDKNCIYRNKKMNR